MRQQGILRRLSWLPTELLTYSLSVPRDGDAAIRVDLNNSVGTVFGAGTFDHRPQRIIMDSRHAAVAARMMVALEYSEYFAGGLQNLADIGCVVYVDRAGPIK